MADLGICPERHLQMVDSGSPVKFLISLMVSFFSWAVIAVWSFVLVIYLSS
jgi:hypothetical protein